MNIDKLIWAIEDYKTDVRGNNTLLSSGLTAENRAQLQHRNQEAARKLESIFNECVDERVRAVLKDMGIQPS